MATPTVSTVQATSTTASDLGAALDTALSDQSNIHLWTFKQFWWIAIAVTGGTLILPLVAGPIFRSLAQFSKKQRELWRLLVFLIALLAIFPLALVTGAVGSLVLQIPMVLLACFQLYRTWTTRARAKRWMFFASLVVACLTFDLKFGAELLIYDGTLTIFGYEKEYYNVKYYGISNFNGPFEDYMEDTFQAGTTGLVPTVWLLVIFFGNKPLLFDADGINKFFSERSRLFRFANPVYWVDLQKAEPTASNLRHRLHLIMVRAVLAAINICISHYSPGWYLPFSFTGSGLYAIYMFGSAVREERNRRFWFAFCIMVAASDVFYYFDVFGGVSIYVAQNLCAPVLFPLLMIWIGNSWRKIAACWRQIQVPNRKKKTRTPSTV